MTTTLFEATCPHCEYQQTYTDPDDEILLCENCEELIYISDEELTRRQEIGSAVKKEKSYTREILLATLLCTLGFIATLLVNAPGQSAFALTMNNMSTTLLSIAAIIGWTWLIVTFENRNKGK